MKTPHLFIRFLGNPVVALCMVAWFLHACAGWYLGQPSVGETIVALSFAACSSRAWRRMRAHRVLLQQWNDTGQLDTEAPTRISTGGSHARRKSALVFIIPALGLMLVLMAANGASGDALPVLRLLALTCVGWLVVAGLRKFTKHGGGQVERTAQVERAGRADTASPVAWVTGPAHSAPSRAATISNLPDYALGVMGLQRRN